MGYAVQIENLKKSYKSNEVLHGISFTVNKGEIFAFLGTNGAGKTTTLECMEGLRKYNGGQIRVEGKCGVQLQSSSLPVNIKAIEAIRYFAKWQRADVDKETIRCLGAEPFLEKQYAQLSTGQKRRLHLVIALLGDPDVVVLDEPTAGLDVEGRVGIHEEIKKLKKMGKTIILASHDMAEVEELCDRIAILKDGQITFLGSPAELTENMQSNFVLKVRFSKTPEPESLNASFEAKLEQGYYTFETKSIEETLTEIIAFAKAQSITLRDVKLEQADIEQRFLEIANK